jgi:putative nucleotidyltransferase with HDIG domain
MHDEVCVVSSRLPSEMPPLLAKVPAFPPVATKLLSLLDDNESNFADIAACVATDPVLSGRLITRANAADLASYCEVRDVLQAARALGIDRTRQISLQTATSFIAGSALTSDTLRPCWHHTLACAIVASEIARLSGLRAAEAYTAGILHDIGRLGLLTVYRAEYEQLMAGAEGQPDDLIRMERDLFGVDHMEAGCWLARRWNLPQSIVEVVAQHHDAPAGTLNEVLVVQIACRIADLLGFGVNRSNQPEDFEQICGALPDRTRERLAAELPALREAVEREIEASERTGGARPAGSPEPSEESLLPEDLPAEEPLFAAPKYRAALIALLVMMGLLLCSGVLIQR